MSDTRNDFVLIKSLRSRSINVYKNNENIDQIHYDTLDDLFYILKTYYSDELMREESIE